MSYGFNPLSRRSLCSALALGSLLLCSTLASAQNAAPATTAPPAATAQASPAANDNGFGQARIIVVEWKIKKGHEDEFLKYWATKSVVDDRSGLIAEFMTTPESKDKFPWIQWSSVDTASADYSTFYNIGIWKKADDFVGQIGKYIDINRPSLPFEADKRHRVLLTPQEWRIGMSALPAKDAEGVK
jgi:hypothetical protein